MASLYFTVCALALYIPWKALLCKALEKLKNFKPEYYYLDHLFADNRSLNYIQLSSDHKYSGKMYTCNIICTKLVYKIKCN